MSSTQNILLLVILFTIIYFLWKPEYYKRIKIQLNKLLNFNSIENFPLESEVGNLQLILPEGSTKEIIILNRFADEIRTKNEFSTQNQPTLNQYLKLSAVDLKNIQAYINSKINNKKIVDTLVEVTCDNIKAEVFYAENNNFLYLTPLICYGQVSINKKVLGKIKYTIILRGKTNSLFIPQDGFFINKNKFMGIIDSFKITELDKPNVEIDPSIQSNSWYATSDTINYSINYPNNPPLTKFKTLERKTNAKEETHKRQQDYQRKQNITILEDSEDFNLSEIINENIPGTEINNDYYEEDSETNLSPINYV